MSGPTTDRKPPTDEQARALGVTDSSVALSAGAGCGKTFVLAERFVRALEGPEASPLGRIVALTFTNKAARELRERIRKECRARLADGRDPLRWRKVLRGLEAARIGTFHSFCGNVLRQHAIEAGVDPGFAVFDETIALSIREEALDVALRERLTLRDPDLIELAVEYGLGMVRQSLDNLLGNRSAGDLRAWTGRQPRELVDGWVKVWDGEVRPALLAAFREKIKPCLDLIATTSFDNAKVRVRLDEFRDWTARLDEPGDPTPTLARIAETAKVQGLAAKLWPSADVYEAIKEHFETIRKDATKLIEALRWDEPSTLKAAEHGLMLARLLERGRAAYDHAKRSRGGIDNDDLLLLTRDLLLDPSKGARDSLAESIDLVLVDEFQDTDPVQAQVLEALGGSALLDGKLFLVGDFKQSIYRFRGARPELFQDYRERFPEAGRLALSANFRSVPAILDFVNALFADTFNEPDAALRPGGRPIEDDGPPAIEFSWAPEAEKAPADKPDASARRKEEARRLARHLRERLDEGWMIHDKKDGRIRPASQGDVAFLFRSLSDASEYEQALVGEGLDFHVVGGSGFYAQQEVLDLINVLTAVDNPLDGVSLAGALRSPFFSISDDALYWLATERKGFPHEGLERIPLGYVGSAIADLASSHESKRSAIADPTEDLSTRPANALDKLPEGDRPRAARARRLLDAWRSIKDRVPIASLIDRILSESGYEAALIGETLGDRKRANARKLVRMASRFDEQGGFTLADFVARLRADLRGATKENQASTTDEEGEIIRLMSIHQAKGLEFPIVVLPDLDRKRPGELERVAFDNELGPLVNPVVDLTVGEDGEESESGNCLGWTLHRHRERLADDAEALRLFYVALTRARDALVLSSATDPAKKPTSPALSLLDRRFDRSTGLLKATLPDGWNVPRIRIVGESPASGRTPAWTRRPQPRLLEVARIIREGLASPAPTAESRVARPRFVELDPAHGLASTASRLDRLIRTILADPRALEPSRLAMIAARASRIQDPVAPDRLIQQAIERIEAWSRSVLGREVARATEVHRAFPWVIRRPVEGDSSLFQGRGDFLYRRPTGELGLVILSDPAASDLRERLRLLLSTYAARELAQGVVSRADWVRFGEGGSYVDVRELDEAAIDRAVVEFIHGGPWERVNLR
jgi:ATP-dependent helicase/nuclease subunit A